ncbi:hypothetical protein WJX79_004788 [Trebouxia sp. C0005]|nr:MAG: hypothetical protein FRX49_11937 [Trebouxia sp. A1-2]
MSQVTGQGQLLRAPGVSRTGQAPFRRVCASARSPHSVSHVTRRAALIAAGLISTVQALAAEEKPTSEKSITDTLPHTDQEPPQYLPMMEEIDQLGAQAQARHDVNTKVEDPESPKGDTKGPAIKRQHFVVMRHGERIDEMDKSWSAQASRPYDPYLTPKGEEQAKAVAEQLKQFDIKKVYISPFYRCLQTTMFAMEGVKVSPENWTISCAVSEFLNPWIMVKKGGKLPQGHINDWFWEDKDMKDYMATRLPKDIASRIKYGQQTFLRFPENLLNSRARYAKAFQDIADEVDGENVLIVTHGDAVNSSVTRLMPWTIVYPVLHTGFTVAYRDQHQDGTWGGWVLQSSSGESGVWWTGKLKPAYQVFEGALNVYDGAYGVYNRWAPSWAPFRQPAGAPKAEGSKA